MRSRKKRGSEEEAGRRSEAVYTTRGDERPCERVGEKGKKKGYGSYGGGVSFLNHST